MAGALGRGLGLCRGLGSGLGRGLGSGLGRGLGSGLGRGLGSGLGRGLGSGSGPGFRPRTVAVVVKTTRYEFEQQRHGINEHTLRHLLTTKGSSYNGLLERHQVHGQNVQHIVDSLREAGIEVRVVKRRDYDEETVRWADAIISAGGDGTMLLTASKVQDKHKPVIGVNTDPERSQGHLCLPLHFTYSFPDALRRLQSGHYRWLWRHRLRIRLEGIGINIRPVDLHQEQLNLQQQQVHRSSHSPDSLLASGPHLLPVRALNEVFIGESLSSRPSYFEISVQDGPWEKQKNSGLNIATGTGSKAWSYNINKLVKQEVREVLAIAKNRSSEPIDEQFVEGAKNRSSEPIDERFVEGVTEVYNQSLVFGPDEPRMFYSIREPIVNRVFPTSRHHGFTDRIAVRSRCWDACMVLDSGTSFEFNDGAIATISIDQEDALCTVLLDS